MMSWWPDDVKKAFDARQMAEVALVNALLRASGHEPDSGERWRQAVLGSRGTVWPAVLAAVAIGTERNGRVSRTHEDVAADAGTSPHGVETVVGRQASRLGGYEQLPVRWDGSFETGEWNLSMDANDARAVRTLLVGAGRWPYANDDDGLFPEAMETVEALERDEARER